jgi:hypothetical protein
MLWRRAPASLTRRRTDNGTLMTEAQFFEIVHPTLRELGAIPEEGEEYRDPPLDVLRYTRRTVRLNAIPWLGRGLSVVAVVRQPIDIAFSERDYGRLLARLSLATNTRFPPWARGRGPVLGLTIVTLTPEPIGPDDDQVLARVLSGKRHTSVRARAVPLGIIRVNLGQEAMSFALLSGPAEVFHEPAQLADALALHLRRFVPSIEA